jgi:hypothetical protein
MRYAGLTEFRGKAYYRFVAKEDMATAPQEVLIPADVEGCREEYLCFQSGWASGFSTALDVLFRPPPKTSGH